MKIEYITKEQYLEENLKAKRTDWYGILNTFYESDYKIAKISYDDAFNVKSMLGSVTRSIKRFGFFMTAHKCGNNIYIVKNVDM